MCVWSVGLPERAGHVFCSAGACCTVPCSRTLYSPDALIFLQNVLFSLYTLFACFDPAARRWVCGTIGLPELAFFFGRLEQNTHSAVFDTRPLLFKNLFAVHPCSSTAVPLYIWPVASATRSGQENFQRGTPPVSLASCSISPFLRACIITE